MNPRQKRQHVASYAAEWESLVESNQGLNAEESKDIVAGEDDGTRPHTEANLTLVGTQSQIQINRGVSHPEEQDTACRWQVVPPRRGRDTRRIESRDRKVPDDNLESYNGHRPIDLSDLETIESVYYTAGRRTRPMERTGQ